MKLILCAISALIMARIVKKYSKLPEVSSWVLDLSIQIIHIITFLYIFINILTIDISISTILTSLYCLFYIVICIKEFFLDALYYIFTVPTDNKGEDNKEEVENKDENEKEEEEQ